MDVKRLKKSGVLASVLAILLMILLAASCSIGGTKASSDEKQVLPAIEIEQKSYIHPEGGIALSKARDLVSAYLRQNGVKGEDPLPMKLAEITTKEAWENSGVQLFRVDVDYAWLYGVAVMKEEKVLCVLDGMPTYKVFLADLDLDGRYEVYTNVAFGSGIVSMEIRGYNVSNGSKYSLSKRMKRDLYVITRDKVLWVNEYLPMKNEGKPAASGKLSLRDNGGKKELNVEGVEESDN